MFRGYLVNAKTRKYIDYRVFQYVSRVRTGLCQYVVSFERFGFYAHIWKPAPKPKQPTDSYTEYIIIIIIID